MLILDAAIQAALDSGRIKRREFLKFEFPSGTYGFWTGAGPITYSGIVYQNAGSVIAIGGLSGMTDGAAVPIQVHLSSIPNSELTPDVLTGIFAEDYKFRPVFLYRGIYDPVTGALIADRWLRWSGFVDYIENVAEPGGPAKLIFYCESRRFDDQRTGYRMWSDEDQRKIDSNDRFFQNVTTAGKRAIDWGRRPDKPKGKNYPRRRK